VVERTAAWLRHLRRHCILWEESSQTFAAYLQLASPFLLLRHVLACLVKAAPPSIRLSDLFGLARRPMGILCPGGAFPGVKSHFPYSAMPHGASCAPSLLQPTRSYQALTLLKQMV